MKDRANEAIYELELGNKRQKFFILVKVNPLKILVDFKGLPFSAFLCAGFDNVPMENAKCGDRGQFERFFVDIDWVINEWGGDDQIIYAVKKRKQLILDDIENIKRKLKDSK